MKMSRGDAEPASLLSLLGVTLPSLMALAVVFDERPCTSTERAERASIVAVVEGTVDDSEQ